MLLKCCSQYASKFGNSAVATGQIKVSFYSNSKEGHCQRKFKLLHNCAHFTCQQGNVENPSSQATESFQMYNIDLEKAEESEIKLPISIGSQKKQGNSRKISTSASLTMLNPLSVQIKTNWKILNEIGIAQCLTCLLINLYAGQGAKLELDKRLLQIGKGECQGSILSPCLFNLYADYILHKISVDEEQAGIRININNL